MQHMYQHSKQKNAGFTLIELLVIIPVLMLVVTGIIVAMTGLVLDNSQSQKNVAVTYNVNAALNIIEQDLKLASSYLTTIDSSHFSDPYTTDGGSSSWSFTGTSANTRTLIISTYATDKDPDSTA